MNKIKRQNEEYDSPWKTIVENLFPEFLEFFFPTVSKHVNWEIPADFLNSELAKIVKNAHEGRRFADKLVRVRTLNGDLTLLFIHIEIQASRDKDFAKRMFIYNNRIVERYGEAVVSLAVLADASQTWHPQTYKRKCLGTTLQFGFLTAKLLSMAEQCQDLSPNQSPFAWIVRAHLDSLATRNNDAARFVRMKEIYRCLYAAKFAKSTVREVLGFCDWILTLPTELDVTFQEYVGELEVKMGKPYVPRFERKALEIGIQQGIQQGEQKEAVLRIQRALEKRFNLTGQDYVTSISHLSHDEINELFDLALETNDVEKIRSWFAAHPLQKIKEK